MLADGVCGSCGHRYLQDLPSGHGLLYPASLDLDTGETFQAGDAPWFSQALSPSWEHPDDGPVEFEISGRASGRGVVLLNCLDKVYGHSLLKLLNAARHLGDAERGLVVLIPGALAPLVPAGVEETWVVREPSSRFSGWLLELEDILQGELDRLGDCLLSRAFPHPHPSTYSLDSFVGDVTPLRSGSPSIVLSLRSDRLWGVDKRDQAARVERLWDALTDAFPEASAVAVGASDLGQLPAGIDDATEAQPSADTERRWLGLMRGADLAIGVHGSNMLLPSGLARATLELMPASRYGNAFQATLLGSRDPITALVRHRVLYGSEDLADVAPEHVVEIAISVLRYGERSEHLLSGPAAGQGPGDVPSLDVQSPPPPVPPRQESVSLRRVRPLRAARRLVDQARAGRQLRQRASEARAADPPLIVNDVRGLAFELATHDEIQRFLVDGGHVEAVELRLASAYLEPGMIAIDAGANFGVFTATLAAAVGDSGAVHSFEPLAAARHRLERTIELNRLDNVMVNDLAVSDRSDTVTLFDYGPGYESWATMAPREIETAGGIVRAVTESSVQSTTLDRYCEQYGIERVDLLKIDVEGLEERVLLGAERLMRGAVDLVILEVADTTLEAAGSRAHTVIDILERSGLRTYALDGGALRPFRVAGEHRSLTNVVAASAAARERLRRLGWLT
jgi:FkbM family methyltransferase